MKKIILSTLVAIITFQGPMAKACDGQQVFNEIQNMQQSAYWQGIFNEVSETLNKTYSRGCSSMAGGLTVGLDIFMDDLEFTGPYDSHRQLATSGSYSVGKDSRNTFWAYAPDKNFYQPNVIQVGANLQEGSFSLLAKTCSPKVALANIAAYVPHTLKSKCGSNAQNNEEVNRAIEARIQSILANEK